MSSPAVQTAGGESRLREEICALGRSIFERGLTAGSSGNVSVRLEDGWLFTPTNVSLGGLDPARLSKLDDAGRLVSGDPPSKEAVLHRAVYEERGQARAVVHLHSTYAAAISCMDGLDCDDCLPPLTAYFVMKIGRLPLIPYTGRAIRDWETRSVATLASTAPCFWRITGRWCPARRSRRPRTRSRSWSRPRSCSYCCAPCRRGR